MRKSLFSMRVPCQFYFLSKIVWNHKWFPSFWFHFWRSLLWTRARYSSLSPPRLNFVTRLLPLGRSWEPELPLCLRTHHHFLFQHNSNWTRKWLNFTFWQDFHRVRKTLSARHQCWPESFCKSGKFCNKLILAEEFPDILENVRILYKISR